MGFCDTQMPLQIKPRKESIVNDLLLFHCTHGVMGLTVLHINLPLSSSSPISSGALHRVDVSCNDRQLDLLVDLGTTVVVAPIFHKQNVSDSISE
jgi:hypothetical protein